MMFFQFFSHLANLPPVMFSELTVLCNLEATNCTETAFYLTMLSSPIQFLVKLCFTFVFPFQTRKMFCCKVLTAFATVGITHFCGPRHRLSTQLQTAARATTKANFYPLSKMQYFRIFCCLRSEHNSFQDVQYFFTVI